MYNKKSVFHVPGYYQNCHKFTRKYCAIYEVPQITRQNKNYKKNPLDLLKKIVLKVICERSQNISSSDTVRVNVLIIGRRCVKANTTNALF